MKYLCTNCSYTYDEAAGDETEEIVPGTKIDELISCPVCFEEDSFFQVKEEVNYLDENTIDKVELDHQIELNHNGLELEIIIGKEKHPMEKEHRILSVSLFDEYGDLVEEKFLKESSDLRIIFDDYDLDEIEVRLNCNKHGIFSRKFALNY